MLGGMQQSGQAQPSPASRSFAGLLASFAAPQTQAGDRASLWDDGDLGEDVATLSYESALRAAARNGPMDRADWPQASRSLRLSKNGETALAARSGESAPERANAASAKGRDGELRSASVTVRLSGQELEQLRQRAIEAGLTVSAYLRSCTFEAESLRAQVKAALAELRKAGTETTLTAGTTRRGNEKRRPHQRFGWLARLVAGKRDESRSAARISLPAAPGI